MDVAPEQNGGVTVQIHQPKCGHLMQFLTLIPSPTNVFIAVPLLSSLAPLLTPLTVFIFCLIYTPTHRWSHSRLTLILPSVFIYLLHPVLSLSDYINTTPHPNPPTPALLSFILSHLTSPICIASPLMDDAALRRGASIRGAGLR